MSGRGMWRHLDRLPVRAAEHIVTLGEGDTPLLDLPALASALGVARVQAKAEDRNPTGSFKARVASVAYSLVRERGLLGAVGTSSGNGGAAAAAYAAASGSRAVLFTLSDAAPVKLREIAAVGGTAIRVAGVGHDAASTRNVADVIAGRARDAGFYPMLTGFHYAPEAMQGVKTLAYELAEEAPDTTAVYTPVGGGGLITGLGLGYTEEATAGRSRRPRLVGVQPAGSAALRRALDGHPEGLAGPVDTMISGLQMAALYDADGAVEAVCGSGGHAVEVTDQEIWMAQSVLARDHGLLVEPAGATALAGLLADVRAGRLDPSDRIVVITSGAGYKDVDAMARMAGDPAPPVIDADEVGDRLAALVGVRP